MIKSFNYIFVSSVLFCESALGMPSDWEHNYELSTKQLNTVYQKLMKVVEKESSVKAAELKEAERAWIRYRDKECQFVQDIDQVDQPDRGTWGCLNNLTEQRLKQLQEYLETYESNAAKQSRGNE